MDGSKENPVNHINDRDWSIAQSSESNSSSEDPLEGLRALLVEAICDRLSDNPPTPGSISSKKNSQQIPSDTQEGDSIAVPRSIPEKETARADRAVAKKNNVNRRVHTRRHWKTLTVEHQRIEESPEKSHPGASDNPAALRRDRPSNPVGIEPLEPKGLQTPPDDSRIGESGQNPTPPPGPIVTVRSETVEDIAESHPCSDPLDGDLVHLPDPLPTPLAQNEQLEKLAEDNQQLQQDADSLLSGMEHLESILLEEQKLHEPTETSLGSVETLLDPIENLQNLLLGSKLSEINQIKNLLNEYDLEGFRTLLAKIDKHLQALEYQIYDPQELIELMKPWIAEILSRKVADSKDEVAQALVPIIDEVIKNRSQQNKAAMSEAISSVLPSAISQQIRESPEDVAKAIAPEMAIAIKEQIRLDRDAIAKVLAPEMGRTIKEQIRIERDAMVDALYPVIGNTISKYMMEVIHSMNEKVANALSFEGIKRKFRAKIRGVSEAELILEESMPFVLQAIFLIHKASGLVISEQQQSGTHKLESEMVAGMLTAIRSFVNDCIVKPGEFSELSEIEYGNSKIILEVAGYCYVAVVGQGEPSKKFIKKMQKTVGILILDYGQPIEEYNGDPATIPAPVHELIEALMETASNPQRAKQPVALVCGVLVIVSLIAVPWGIFEYKRAVNRDLEQKTALALSSAPELAVYRLEVEASGNVVKIGGKLPNRELRQKAAEVASAVVGDRKLKNEIIPVKVPADPVIVSGEIDRVQAILNQIEGVSISTTYADGKVTVNGSVMEMADAKKITQAIEQIPGVESVVSTVKLDPLKITSRIYFDRGSAELNPEYETTLVQIEEFLSQYPKKNIRIIGHSDRTGNKANNQKLALQRSQAVKDALIEKGVEARRLQAVGNVNSPKDVEANQPLLLNRVVVFEPIPSGEPSQ